MKGKHIWQICLKDIKVELRTRIILFQVLPFGLLTLVLFAFAFEADRASLRQYAPGLFWVTILLATSFFVLRNFSLEVESGAIYNLRLSAIKPAHIFFGKALALFLGIFVLEIFLGVAAFFLYDISVENPALLIVASLLGTIAIASSATTYGILSANLKARETILPLLMLPVLIPVFLGAIRTFDDALGSSTANGWAWLSLLGAFAFIYTVFGSFAFGEILDEVEPV